MLLIIHGSRSLHGNSKINRYLKSPIGSTRLEVAVDLLIQCMLVPGSAAEQHLIEMSTYMLLMLSLYMSLFLFLILRSSLPKYHSGIAPVVHLVFVSPLCPVSPVQCQAMLSCWIRPHFPPSPHRPQRKALTSAACRWQDHICGSPHAQHWHHLCK